MKKNFTENQRDQTIQPTAWETVTPKFQTNRLKVHKGWLYRIQTGKISAGESHNTYDDREQFTLIYIKEE